MKTKLFVALVFIGIWIVTSTASAQPPAAFNFVAPLSGDEEVPPVDTNATGLARFQLIGDELDFLLIVANIENITQAHIHCGAAGVNGPVVVFLFGFDPDGVTVNGILSEGTITAGDVIPVRIRRRARVELRILTNSLPRCGAVRPTLTSIRSTILAERFGGRFKWQGRGNNNG